MTTKFHTAGHLVDDGDYLELSFYEHEGITYRTRVIEKEDGSSYTVLVNGNDNRVGYIYKCREGSKPDWMITMCKGNARFTCFPDHDGGWNVCSAYEIEANTAAGGPW